MKKAGKFDAVVAEEVCRRLSRGEPLALICGREGLPSVRTVLRWKDSQPAFATEFALAREEGFEVIAADCLAIADETGQDTKLTKTRGESANTEWISRSRLRVETRLKLLAKWWPKKYGDKAEPETPSGDGDVLAEVFRRIRSGARYEA